MVPQVAFVLDKILVADIRIHNCSFKHKDLFDDVGSSQSHWQGWKQILNWAPGNEFKTTL